MFRADLASGPVCIKQALPRLRVAEEWLVSPERAHVEANWLRCAEEIGLPAPRLLFEDRGAHCFAMSFCAGAETWKARLSSGEADAAFAAAVGRVLARMHEATRGREEVANGFANGHLFESLRIDPFLLHCARAHPDLASRLEAIAAATRANAEALIHGDFSPKNILVGEHGPVILDAECATWGDPAFDLAFCATHLLLKSRWRGEAFDALLGDARAFASAYFAGAPTDATAVDARAADLVAALMLARVDGKSPVEYLDGGDRAFVRATARDWLERPPGPLGALFDDWAARRETK